MTTDTRNAGPPMLYEVLDEFGQRIATTATRWTAERLIEGIKAHDSPTSKMGSWSIAALPTPNTGERDAGDDALRRAERAIESLLLDSAENAKLLAHSEEPYQREYNKGVGISKALDAIRALRLATKEQP